MAVSGEVIVAGSTAVRKPGEAILAVLVPGIAMCLGWGLRGQFGGPRGAMVPGALVALALALASRRRYSAAQIWTVATAGALGFAIGGEETYAQTVGLSRNNDLATSYWNATVLWGYLGLLIRGLLWGGFGGLFIGAALGGRRYTTTQLLIGFHVAIGAAFLPYWYVNVPKLIYFSGGAGQGKPRPEAWAALTLAWLALTWLAGRMGDRSAVRLSFYGALGCGIGFAGARLAYAMGERYLDASTGAYIDWWKVMECVLGLIGGLVLGWGWWTARQGDAGREEQAKPAVMPQPIPFALLALDLLLFFYVADAVDGIGGLVGKTPFLFIAPALMILANPMPPLALHLGVTMPVALTIWNVQHYWVEEQHLFGAAPSVACLILLTVLVSEAARRMAGNPRALFLLVAWGGLACAWPKMLIPYPSPPGQQLVTQTLFTLMAIWLTVSTRTRTRTTLE